jgi:D-serine deaminase-like pyridoxal phosphate-dependent protein
MSEFRNKRGGRQALNELDTPCLLLDEARMTRNIERLRAHLGTLGVQLRPHLKTPKSIAVAQRTMDSPAGPAAVSTLKEAEQFADAGVRNILYAVGIAPNKLDRVAALRRRGVDLSIVVDNVEAAQAVAAKARETGDKIPTLIEIDCDGHRAGIPPQRRDDLVAIGRVLQESGAELRGSSRTRANPTVAKASTK